MRTAPLCSGIACPPGRLVQPLYKPAICRKYRCPEAWAKARPGTFPVSINHPAASRLQRQGWLSETRSEMARDPVGSRRALFKHAREFRAGARCARPALGIAGPPVRPSFQGWQKANASMYETEYRGGYTVQFLGQEAEPLVVIDDFSKRPDALVAEASRRTFTPPPPGYPGIRSNAPSEYLMDQAEMLREILTRVFGYTRDAKLIECSFSLVTTAPDKLYSAQRIPHHDSTDPNLIALLHYLSGPEKGGTSHYRHTSTGYETVRQDRLDTYRQALDAEERQDGALPSGYFNGKSPRFQRIAQTEARFNRVVMYRGALLHSGDIPPDFSFSPDVAAGRLTVNSFFLQG
ncbi:DUF6445 family protein [uncultured Maricaulis sp.]|uniref:DUF6445 family protein n=1 Tax=uncultured Maricaulis sp. TaxID=174710 RepID=UPI0025CDD3EB|nr:DUF6445 family protein [uncultured Maricaulis sp.]